MKEYQSLLKGANNTRELSGVVNKSVFWRSGAPVSLTGEDVCLLHEKGFTTLVDMRSDPEVSLRPCSVRDTDEFVYFHFAVNEACVPPATLEAVPLTYMKIADGVSMPEIFRTLANAEGGVMYFCSAGKDRTGVVSAILQLLAGVSDDDIIRDYALSREYNIEVLNAYLAAYPELDKSILLASEISMVRFLELFREKYHSADNYLASLGLSADEINMLRDKMMRY